MSFLQAGRDGSTLLKVYLQPRASANGISGVHGDALKIRITAPPVDGQANEMVVKFIAKLLKIPRSAIAVTSGLQNRNKILTISGIESGEIMARLRSLLQAGHERA